MVVFACLRMAQGRLLADDPRSSACGWPKVVCLRMARGRLPADGPWSSACGWPKVVCLRMAQGRLPADGPRSSACGWRRGCLTGSRAVLAIQSGRRRETGRDQELKDPDLTVEQFS